MKRIIIPLLLLLGIQCSSFNMKRQTAEEIRGVWITNVDSEILSSRATIEAGVQRLASKGFNYLFPVVWNKGYTLYPSAVMKNHFGETFAIDPNYATQSRDPLREIVEIGHQYGMKVIPWFEFGFASSYQKKGFHLIETYPHWAAEDSEGNILTKNGFEWMNGLHPEVQEFMLSLIKEVIDTYEVDGIQGDDRFPAMPTEGGYDAYTTALYQEETGSLPPSNSKDPDWIQWRADKLTQFAGKIHHLVKKKNPNLIVSMSPSIYNWSKQEYLQDWPQWIKNGYVDMVHPQCYRYDIEAYKKTIDEVFDQTNGTGKRDEIIVAPGILVKVGNRFNDANYIKEALAYNRQKKMDGEVFFFYEGLFEKNQFVADTIYQYYYRK